MADGNNGWTPILVAGFGAASAILTLIIGKLSEHFGWKSKDAADFRQSRIDKLAVETPAGRLYVGGDTGYDPGRPNAAAYLRSAWKWTGCDWPTRFGAQALDLNGIKADVSVAKADSVYRTLSALAVTSAACAGPEFMYPSTCPAALTTSGRGSFTTAGSVPNIFTVRSDPYCAQPGSPSRTKSTQRCA